MAAFSGILFFVLSGLLPILVTGGLIYLIVHLSRNKGVKINLGINTLLHIYLNIIAFATLAITVVGATIFLNSAFSYKFGIPFSYEVQEAYSDIKEDMEEPITCYQGELMNIEGESVCFDMTKQKKGIVNGATLTISMLILFAVHKIALIFLEKKGKVMWLKKTYNFVSLITYSSVSIITIPVSIYLLVNYFYFKPENISKIEAPGGAFALAIISIPLWIIFLITTLKLREKEEEK